MRARADRVEAWLERTDVDVVAIQETKCKDDNFPWEVFEHNGYDVAHFGFNQWNGVAIASRVGMKDVERTFADQPAFGKGGKDPVQEARAIAATCDGVRIWSLYVPNGRTLTDEHMEYKLAWLKQLREHAETWLTDDPEAQIALAGDWNIAPQDEDVWDIGFFREQGLTHVSEPEREAFRSFLDSGYADLVRPHAPGPASTPIGITRACASRSGKACGSTSCWGPPRSPGVWSRPSWTRTNAGARGPATTRPSSSTWPERSG